MPLVGDPIPTPKQSQYVLCRTCYDGVLTIEEAQAKLGPKMTVVEVRPAQVLARRNGAPDDRELVPATEVLFFPVPYGGVVDYQP